MVKLRVVDLAATATACGAINTMADDETALTESQGPTRRKRESANKMLLKSDLPEGHTVNDEQSAETRRVSVAEGKTKGEASSNLNSSEEHYSRRQAVSEPSPQEPSTPEISKDEELRNELKKKNALRWKRWWEKNRDAYNFKRRNAARRADAEANGSTDATLTYARQQSANALAYHNQLLMAQQASPTALSSSGWPMVLQYHQPQDFANLPMYSFNPTSGPVSGVDPRAAFPLMPQQHAQTQAVYTPPMLDEPNRTQQFLANSYAATMPLTQQVAHLSLNQGTPAYDAQQMNMSPMMVAYNQGMLQQSAGFTINQQTTAHAPIIPGNLMGFTGQFQRTGSMPILPRMQPLFDNPVSPEHPSRLSSSTSELPRGVQLQRNEIMLNMGSVRPPYPLKPSEEDLRNATKRLNKMQ